MGLTEDKYIWRGKLNTGFSGYSQFVNDIHRDKREFQNKEVEITVKLIKKMIVQPRLDGGISWLEKGRVK